MGAPSHLQIRGYKDFQVLQEVPDRSRDRTGWRISNSVFRVTFPNRIPQTFLQHWKTRASKHLVHSYKSASIFKAVPLHMDFYSQVSAG